MNILFIYYGVLRYFNCTTFSMGLLAILMLQILSCILMAGPELGYVLEFLILFLDTIFLCTVFIFLYIALGLLVIRFP
jgi:hypothetical protein